MKIYTVMPYEDTGIIETKTTNSPFDLPVIIQMQMEKHNLADSEIRITAWEHDEKLWSVNAAELMVNYTEKEEEKAYSVIEHGLLYSLKMPYYKIEMPDGKIIEANVFVVLIKRIMLYNRIKSME